MRKLLIVSLALLLINSASIGQTGKQRNYLAETKTQKEQRMKWWKDARFGLFIHWGLYAVPAGEWNGETNHAEWIRTTAKIPLTTYDSFVHEFNPVKFNAADWVQMAKDAGMKYIVITSKHHDGFGLFDSKQTDFDIMSTPFQRDVLKELAAACKQAGITLCFYHSIMDWHHPDYLPRRDWEKDRPADGAEFTRYITYMKSQLKELLTNYGKIGVIWFDGEWESTWTHENGKDLYQYVRTLQPSVIINNRVDKGREGMGGLNKDNSFIGDFGTPEQEIPATGTPGVAWESCMTMNNNWGYNSHDQNWKTSEDLVRKLIDIASKGGNFLLNVGPTSAGEFPAPAVERLKEIGAWMKTNGESIYGTEASAFRNLSWGRSTRKTIPGGTRIYLQVFDWPADGKLLVPGLGNTIIKTYALSDKSALKGQKMEGDYVIDVSGVSKQDFATVIVIDVKGRPVIYDVPTIKAPAKGFVKDLPIEIIAGVQGAKAHYTLNGEEPTASSPIANGKILLTEATTVKTKNFIGSTAISATASQRFEKMEPLPGIIGAVVSEGLNFSLYEGKWNAMPDFSTMKPILTGVVPTVQLGDRKGTEQYAYVFEGLISIPADDVYEFYVSSDDGSRLQIDNEIIDNDGAHSLVEKSKEIPLARGYHSFKLMYFQNSGGDDLFLNWKRPSTEKRPIPAEAFYRKQ